MTIPFRRLAAVLALAAQPAALLAQDGRAGDVRKVTDAAGREVPSYPTPLAEVLSGTAVARAVTRDAPVAPGEAVLTKAALTHVRMTPGQPEAVLFAHTLVRFDAANRWLLRNGAAFIVNRRGKLAVVVEGLETLFVGSEVYVEKTEAGLLAYVVEGFVVIGAAGMAGAAPTGLGIGPGQAARVVPGGTAQRAELDSAQRARVERQIEIARTAMGAPPAGGGGGAVAAGVVLGLGAAGAGAYFLAKDDEGDEPAAAPDLLPLPAAVGSACGRDTQQRLFVRVTNAGTARAAASVTRLSSPSLRVAAPMLPTPSLAAGETAVLLVPVEAACVCPAEIAADAGQQVAESDEQNNVVRSACAGPG